MVLFIEDPALYKRLSELIDEAIAEHRAQRLSDAELLARMRRHLDTLRGQGSSDLPPALQGYDAAKAYYGVIKEPLEQYQVNGAVTTELAAEMAIKLEDIIDTHKIRDWVMQEDVQNSMRNAIEDYLFSIKGRYELALDYDTIDRIMEDLLTIAKRRDACS
ncbi:MAG: hypothetical protein R3F53_17315 [Gammaproteobacteria bacterium]